MGQVVLNTYNPDSSFPHSDGTNRATTVDAVLAIGHLAYGHNTATSLDRDLCEYIFVTAFFCVNRIDIHPISVASEQSDPQVLTPSLPHLCTLS